MAYITKSNVATYLGITLTANGESVVDSLIPAIDQAIDTYCGRSWSKQANDNITEIFDGGTDVFFVKNPPIASVVSVKVGKEAGYAGDLLDAAGDEYYIYDTYIQLAAQAVDVPRSVEIVYKSSANALPADIKQAEIQWVAELFKASPDAGKVVKDISIGSMRVSYARGESDMPEYVKRVLDTYKSIPL